MIVTDNAPIQIQGGKRLHGKIRIQGSKNGSLPVMAACLLIEGETLLHNCPRITDTYYMRRLLESVGCTTEGEAGELRVNAAQIREYRLPGCYVDKMRSSVILLGAMLARLGRVRMDYPGGCVIGERPVDLHLMALEKLGARISAQGSDIYAETDGLHGARIDFPRSSVGATQNALLAAVTAHGTTVLTRAACEPEVVELCRFLTAAGADIEGIGTSELVIHGVERLHGTTYRMTADRIVAGTYLFAAMAAGGRIVLEDAPVEQMAAVLDVLDRMGGYLVCCADGRSLSLHAPEHPHNISYVETASYPGFPTDLQSPLLAAASVAEGSLTLRETVFSGRFKIIEELRRMGAHITLTDNCAVIEGAPALTGRNVIARELRGGAALLIAGLAADGLTTVSDTKYIRRGYEDIVGDLAALGAHIG